MSKHDKTILKAIENSLLKYSQKQIILEEPHKVYFFAYLKFNLSLTLEECSNIWANCLIKIN